MPFHLPLQFFSLKKKTHVLTPGSAQERRRVLLQPGSLLIMTGAALLRDY